MQAFAGLGGNQSLTGAFATGIDANDVSGNSIRNSGTINASATASEVGHLAVATGISGDTLSGLTENSGDIMVSATSAAGNAYAAGIVYDDMDPGGLIDNSGQIIVAAAGAGPLSSTEAGAAGIPTPEAMAYGIDLRGAGNGVVRNTGTIIARGPTAAQSVAIDMGSGNGRLELLAPGFVSGRILVDGHDVVLATGASAPISSLWTIEDSSPGSGTFSFIGTSGQPVFVRGEGTGTVEFATFETSNFATQAQMAAGSSALGLSSERAHMEAVLGGSGVEVANGHTGSRRVSGWVSVEGNSYEFDPEGTLLGQDVDTTGLVGGVAFANNNGFVFGATLGITDSDAQAFGAAGLSYDIESDGAFLGLAAATNVSGVMLHGGLRFGSMDVTSTRFINDNNAIGGIGAAVGDTDGDWYALSFGASYDVELQGFTLTPGASLNYTDASFDAYTETGSAAAATVAGYDVDTTDIELSLDISREVGMGEVLGSIGYLWRDTSGDASIPVTIIGDTNGVAAQYSDYSGVTLGLGYSGELSSGWRYEISGNAIVGGDGFEGEGIRAGLFMQF